MDSPTWRLPGTKDMCCAFQPQQGWDADREIQAAFQQLQGAQVARRVPFVVPLLVVGIAPSCVLVGLHQGDWTGATSACLAMMIVACVVLFLLLLGCRLRAFCGLSPVKFELLATCTIACILVHISTWGSPSRAGCILQFDALACDLFGCVDQLVADASTAIILAGSSLLLHLRRSSTLFLCMVCTSMGCITGVVCQSGFWPWLVAYELLLSICLVVVAWQRDQETQRRAASFVERKSTLGQGAEESTVSSADLRAALCHVAELQSELVLELHDDLSLIASAEKSLLGSCAVAGSSFLHFLTDSDLPLFRSALTTATDTRLPQTLQVELRTGEDLQKQELAGLMVVDLQLPAKRFLVSVQRKRPLNFPPEKAVQDVCDSILATVQASVMPIVISSEPASVAGREDQQEPVLSSHGEKQGSISSVFSVLQAASQQEQVLVKEQEDFRSIVPLQSEQEQVPSCNSFDDFTVNSVVLGHSDQDSSSRRRPVEQSRMASSLSQVSWISENMSYTYSDGSDPGAVSSSPSEPLLGMEVQTDITWQEWTFVCRRCRKPPLLPTARSFGPQAPTSRNAPFPRPAIAEQQDEEESSLKKDRPPHDGATASRVKTINQLDLDDFDPEGSSEDEDEESNRTNSPGAALDGLVTQEEGDVPRCHQVLAECQLHLSDSSDSMRQSQNVDELIKDLGIALP